MEILSGFIIGLLGSFHCAGMCGPIVLALPRENISKWSFISGRILYNGGRILTYAFFGAVFGFLGNRIFIYGFQQSLSVITGVIILLTVIFTFRQSSFINRIPFLNKIFIRFKIEFSRLYKRKSGLTMFMTGIMNGFLPCGFVYLGVSGAMLTGDTVSGIIYMALFGLGTVPLMLSISLLGNVFNTGLRNRINRLIPAFTVILALLFIARGLNLGIPYISPKIDNAKAETEEVICH